MVVTITAALSIATVDTTVAATSSSTTGMYLPKAIESPPLSGAPLCRSLSHLMVFVILLFVQRTFVHFVAENC